MYQSLLNQRFKNFQWIIVDNNSTEDVESYFKDKKDKLNIKIVKEFNQGVAYARNKGVEEANSEYIAIMDSDD